MNFLGIEKSPVIVAEVSGNHGGSIGRAYKLIDAAKASGADAVKLQCYTANEMCLDRNYTIKGGQWNGRNLYELYQKNETPRDWIPSLFDYANRIGIPIFSSVFSREGVEFLEKLNCPAYKIAGFESEDLQLIREAIQTRKPVLVSINQFTDASVVSKLIMYSNIIPMHCVSNYPTKRTDANLGRITAYRQIWDNVGYSDHNESGLTASFAAALGASIIERHITLGHSGDDEKFSLNTAQFKLYVKNIRRAVECVDVHEPEDQGNKQFMRSVYSFRDIRKGDRFTKENVRTARPWVNGCGIYRYGQLLTRVASHNIPKESPIDWIDTDDANKGLQCADGCAKSTDE